MDDQGIVINDQSFELDYGRVVIKSGPCTLVLNRTFMKAIAEWYLHDQSDDEETP